MWVGEFELAGDQVDDRLEAILVWNQRRMPFQWRLIMRAAAMIGGRRLCVAHQYTS